MLIRLDGVSRRFEHEGASVAALRDVSLELPQGGMVCIHGPSGAGKTTLLRILGLLDRPDAGSYRLFGKEVRELSEDGLALLRRHVFGFVFQENNLLESANAQENVELPGMYARLGRDFRKNRAAELLSELGLSDRRLSWPDQLSGGEQQRVAVARALMNGGRAILADEPTGALDQENSEAIMRLLEALAGKGHTVVVASHDPGVARRADRLIEMRDGVIVGDSAGSRPKGKSPASFRLPRLPEPSAGRPFGELTAACRTGWASVRSMLTRKFQLRTAMLALSVAVSVGLAGITPIIAMGAFRDVIAESNKLGIDAITVLSVNLFSGAHVSLTSEDERAITQELPEVRAVSREIMRRGRDIEARHGAASAKVRLHAFVDLGSPEGRGGYSYRLESGRNLSLQDNDNPERPAVLCAETRRLLFPSEADPVGEELFLENQRFRVVGVLKPFWSAIRGSAAEEVLREGDSFVNSCVFVPPGMAAAVLHGAGNLILLHIYVRDLDRIVETAGKVRDLLIRRHGQEGFMITHKADQIAKARQARDQALFGFGSLTAVAMLASGFSVAAAMLMSVTARTREIGIRKALGARNGDIRRQFVIEALILTLGGGLVGLAFCLLAVPVLQAFGVSAALSPRYLAAPLIGAVVLGLGCGAHPAARAARIAPALAIGK